MPSEDRSLSEVSTAEAPTPAVVGRYRLLSTIGRGGFARVYFARDRETYAPYALKVLHEALDPRVAEQVRTRFLAEERIAKAIGHPAIVKIRETSTASEEPCYIAMEHIKGQPFCAYFHKLLAGDDGDRTTYPTQDFLFEVARLGHQVASALAVAHERSIVHRDLKPDNVLVAETEPGGLPEIKILDFGIAKAPVQLFSIAAPSVTRYWTELGTVMGSAPYMAPEQNGAAHTVTGKADVYALGVMLMMTVFRLDYDSIERGQSTLRLPYDFERLSLLAPPLPKAWTTLLTAMIASEPDSRPAMRDVARKLQRLARREHEFASAVERFLEHGKLPGTRALRKFSTWAETTHYLTADETWFLNRAPLHKLERVRRVAKLTSVLALLLGCAIVALGTHFRKAPRGSKHIVAQSPTRTEPLSQSQARAPELLTQTLASETQAKHAKLERELSKLTGLLEDKQQQLASQLRVSDEQKIHARALNEKLASCATSKERIESELAELGVRTGNAEKQLVICRNDADEQAAAVSSCQRELGGKVQDLAESTDRLRLCSRSLRDCQSPNVPAALDSEGPS